jgi:hypothetical protein
MSSNSRKIGDSVVSQRAANIRKTKGAKLDHEFLGRCFGMLTVVRRAENVGNASAWECRCECGVLTIVRGYCLRDGQRSCGCILQKSGQDWRLKNSARGSRSPRWKGGRYYGRGGYVFLTNPEYPGKPIGVSYWKAREHVVVMSRHMGRSLTPDETVHHKNGVRDDNRLENLELWSSSHPSGQRIEDKVKWALEIIKKYGVGNEGATNSSFQAE